MSQFDELPDGWEWINVKDVADVGTGATPLKKKKEYYDGGTVPWVTSGLLNSPFIAQSEEKITGLAVQETNAKIFPKHTLLVAMYGEGQTRGRVSELLIEAATNQACAAILLQGDASNLKPYIKYFFLRNYADIRRLSSGGVQPNLNLGIIKATKIPLPPLNEQRRIVEKIEALTARSRKARAALDEIPALLDQFRRSVLAAAFRGDLTADWRAQNPDVEPAEALLERIRVERRKRWEKSELKKIESRGKTPQNDNWKEKYKEPVFEEYDLPSDVPESWAATYIGEISDCLDSLRFPINKDERANRVGEIPYYGANGQVGWIDEYIYDEELVIVVEDETFIGRIKPFSYKISGKSWVNNHAHVLRPVNGISVNFLNYSLMFYPFIPLTSGTTGRRKLTQKSLMAAPYKLPPLQEQDHIVALIEKYFSLADALQNELIDGLSHYETLDQSILAKAFRGELVPQDPNDEPAAVLLDRIRAERERLGSGKKRGKAKV